MINLPPRYLKIVKQILAKQIPQYEVWVFGSRVSGTTKAHSDLDLAIITDKVLDLRCLAYLREAFEESNLPIRVDLVDWASISDEFQEVIRKKYEVIQS